MSDPGPCEQRLEGVRLRAALSRMQPTLVPIKTLNACRKGRMWCGQTQAVWLHRLGTHERSPTLQGSEACDDVPGVHDETFVVVVGCPVGRWSGTVKSLYRSVNPLRQ